MKTYLKMMDGRDHTIEKGGGRFMQRHIRGVIPGGSKGCGGGERERERVGF